MCQRNGSRTAQARTSRIAKRSLPATGNSSTGPAKGWPAFEPTGKEFVPQSSSGAPASIRRRKSLPSRTGASLRIANGLFEISEQLPLHLASDGAPML